LRKRLPRRRGAAAAKPQRFHHSPRPEHRRPRAPRRGVRRPLPPHPHLGGPAVRAGRHHLGAGALLRARLTMDTPFFDLPGTPRIPALSWPTRVVVGAGALKRLADEVQRLGLRRPLVVTDAGVMKAGLGDRVIAVLGEAGIVHVLFDRVTPDPTEPDVFAGLEAYRTGGCDRVIALGGGRPPDAAEPGPPPPTHAPPPSPSHPPPPAGPLPPPPPRPRRTPTRPTAGTGSEVSRSGVAFLQDTQRKTVIFAPQLLPRAAIVDPELTYGLPPRATAATGLDAFTHCLEAYLSNGFHPLADAVAIDGIRRVSRSLPVVMQEPTNRRARLAI